MTTLEMIKEWEKGCSCAMDNPIECKECTLALIEAIKKNEINLIYPFKDRDCESVNLNIIPQIGFYGFNVSETSIELKGDKQCNEVITIGPVGGDEK